MPLWGNTDAGNQKPKSPYQRQVREVVQLTTANVTNVAQTTITFVYNDGAGNNVANIGVAAGQYVYIYPNGPASVGGTAGNGYPAMFSSNNTVASVSGNNVILTNPTFNQLAAGSMVEFDKAISYPSTKPVEQTYNSDTILVTATRAANANNTVANTGNFTAGWVHIQKKTNNDGTVRYLKETLVALANGVASNTTSGNTSFGQIVSGV